MQNDTVVGDAPTLAGEPRVWESGNEPNVDDDGLQVFPGDDVDLSLPLEQLADAIEAASVQRPTCVDRLVVGEPVAAGYHAAQLLERVNSHHAHRRHQLSPSKANQLSPSKANRRARRRDSRRKPATKRAAAARTTSSSRGGDRPRPRRPEEKDFELNHALGVARPLLNGPRWAESTVLRLIPVGEITAFSSKADERLSAQWHEIAQRIRDDRSRRETLPVCLLCNEPIEPDEAASDGKGGRKRLHRLCANKIKKRQREQHRDAA